MKAAKGSALPVSEQRSLEAGRGLGVPVLFKEMRSCLRPSGSAPPSPGVGVTAAPCALALTRLPLSSRGNARQEDCRDQLVLTFESNTGTCEAASASWLLLAVTDGPEGHRAPGTAPSYPAAGSEGLALR